MRQIRFGCRADHVELGGFGPARCSTHAAGVADAQLLVVEVGPQRRRQVVGGLHLSSQLVEGAQAGIERRVGSRDRRVQLVAPRGVALQIFGAPRRAQLQLAARFLETADLGAERTGALDQPGMGRLGFRGAARLRLHPLARLEQPPLGVVQLLVGGALIDLDPSDRFPRLVVTRLLQAQLLLGRPALVAI